MKQLKLIFILIAILFLAFPQHGFAKDTKNVGKIADISGTVELKKSGGKKQFKAVRNMSVTQGDTISTGAKSKAVLHIDGDKEVTIAANTKVVIKQLVKSIKAEQGKTQLSLVGGKVKVKINKKLQGDSKFQVQTPNAIMGVMGTEFNVAFGNGQTTIGVDEGVVRVTPTTAPDGTTPDEQQYDVYPQQMMQVDGEGSAPPRQMTEEDRAFFNSEPDLSQPPTDNEQNPSSAQAIQYGPVGNVDDEDDDDDDRSSGGGSSGGGSSNSGGTTPTTPGDSGNTPDPGNTTDPGQTTDPGNTTDPGQTTDPGNTTDPGQTTDPGNTTDPGQTIDPGTTPPPTQTEQERGFDEGVAAKKTSFLAQLELEGTSTALTEIIEDVQVNAEPYWEGYSAGEGNAYGYSGDPTEDYTVGYDIGYAESFVQGYLEGYEMTHGAPAFDSYTFDDVVLFYQYYNAVPSDSEFDIGFMEGLASVDELEFTASEEATQHYDNAYNAAVARLSAMSLDDIRAFGEEEGFINTISSLGYEQGRGAGGDPGRAAGEASTP